MLEYSVFELPEEQGIVGASANGQFAATPEPATLTAQLEGGLYLIQWYAEFMRTTAAGGSRVVARVTLDATNTLGELRIANTESGPQSGMPPADVLNTTGEIRTFAGTTSLVLGPGSHELSLQYGLANSPSAGQALKVRRQRFSVIRLR